MSYRVLLDPGHGSHDPGAVHLKTGLKEAHVAWDVAERLRRILLAYGEQFDVYMSRKREEFLSLSARAELANRIGVNLLLSIHCNSASNPSAHGFEVFTSPGQTESDVIATHLYNAWQKKFPQRTGRQDTTDNDPDKEASFTVLTRTRASAVLFELEFIHNDAGAAFLSRPEYQDQMAQALADGLLRYRGEIVQPHVALNPEPLPECGYSEEGLREARKGMKAVHDFLETLG